MINQQQDSFEMLEFVLEQFHQAEIQHTGSETTMINRIFGGKLFIENKCLKCQTQSTRTERHDNVRALRLHFPTQHAADSKHTTQSLLNLYFSPEQMINDNQYFCDECKTLCDGERQISIEKGPSHLILVIKHFEFIQENNVRRKLLRKVHHDEQITLMTRSGVRLKYDLYAVIIHSGVSMDAGHYFTFVNQAGNWFKLNDNTTSHFDGDINGMDMLNTPYILFYKLQTESNEEAKGEGPIQLRAIDKGKHLLYTL